MSSTSATSEPRQSTHSIGLGDDLPSASQVNLYHLLAKAFGPVADMDESDAELLRQIGPELPCKLRDAVAELANAWSLALDDRESLNIAHARLFLGPFEIHAPPYESMYLEPDKRLMGEVSRAVAHVYAEAGLGPGAGPNELPDHITHELEFMYYTGFQAISTGDPVWTARRQQFWNDHLSRWIPLLATNMLDADTQPFYNALANVLNCLHA